MIKNIKGWEISKKRKPRSFCSFYRYKWSGFWPVTRFDCKINTWCCVQFKNRQAWCGHFKHHKTEWSFHGKSKWGKQMFDWTLFGKKVFINWPFQDLNFSTWMGVNYIWTEEVHLYYSILSLRFYLAFLVDKRTKIV